MSGDSVRCQVANSPFTRLNLNSNTKYKVCLQEFVHRLHSKYMNCDLNTKYKICLQEFIHCLHPKYMNWDSIGTQTQSTRNAYKGFTLTKSVYYMKCLQRHKVQDLFPRIHSPFTIYKTELEPRHKVQGLSATVHSTSPKYKICLQSEMSTKTQSTRSV